MEFVFLKGRMEGNYVEQLAEGYVSNKGPHVSYGPRSIVTRVTFP